MRCQARQPQGLHQLRRLTGIDEPDLVGERTTVAERPNGEAPASVTVGPTICLEGHPGEDPEPSEQRLGAAHDSLGDHVEADRGRPLANRDVTLGLEETS